ncbi:hypothetical protein [Geothrix sp.]|jgi:hypothetical protein|uniref:hypothetical protein n=1 Tax=Geothrix sp. TaxID=1962974 RepID=UPI0025B862B2|nr:hypothetical protein [Geothrix sp.]
MADLNRKPILDRLTALVAGPFLMGREALSLAFLPDKDAPPEMPPKETLRPIPITPPEHAIKRRG